MDGQLVTLQIWDTAGQERFQSLSQAYYRGADCCFLVYDITNRLSFEHVDNWKQNFLTKSMVKEPETFPFIVLGNKMDMANSDPSTRCVSESELGEWCQTNGAHSGLETSAKENHNVEKAFLDLARLALKRQASMQE